MTTEQGMGGSPRAPHERAPQVDYVELGVQDADIALREYKVANPGSSDDVVKDKARNEYTPIIKQKIRRKEADGKEVRESLETYETFTPEASEASQNILRVLAEFVQAAQQNIITRPRDVQTRAVFDSLIEQVEGKLTKKSAAFLLPLIDGMMQNETFVRFSAEGQPPTQFEQDLATMLTGKDDEILSLISGILTRPISQGKIQNIDSVRFRAVFEAIKKGKKEKVEQQRQEKIDEARKRNPRENSSMVQQEFERIFGDYRDDKEKERAFKLYEAIQGASIEDFRKYYLEKIRLIQEETGCDTKEAGEKITDEIHKTLLYTINTIFSTVLARSPTAQFEQICQQQTTGFVNPMIVFNEAIAGNLSRLLDAAKESADQDGPWCIHDRVKTEIYNPERQKQEETTVPLAHLTETTLSKFVNSLGEIAQMEKGALAYQFNLRFLIDRPDQFQEKGGIFAAMAGFAKENLKTETIDHLYILPHNEIIQAAIMSLEPMYKRVFAKYDWRKDPSLQSELFEQMKPAEKKALEQLRAYFNGKDGTVPSWAIERAFNHARLMSFGKEFFFQALSSFADPYLTDTGEQTYLGEGPFAGNSVYDVFEAAKRWGSADPIIVKLPYMPQKVMIDEFHPHELVAEGEKRWKDSFQNGQLAYYDHDLFRQSNPLISMTNFTKMGGVDTYGGWRVSYTYANWLGEIYDRKSNSLDLTKGKDVLVHGWKAIENIGTNVLKNYADSFIFPTEVNSDTEGQFEEFFKFLYKRYFQEGMGKSLMADVQNDQAFWAKVKAELAGAGGASAATQGNILKKYVYDALTVALFERMPLEFVFMERRRASQNGVTLQQELLEEFIGSPDEGNKKKTGKWTENARNPSEFDEAIKRKWDVAFDDLIYVQQVARIESIQQMKQMEQSAANGGSLGVLYGDLSQDRSQVQYAVTPALIERALQEKYAEDPDREGKVARAKELYESIFKRIQEKPKEGILERRWKATNSAKYREVRENHITTRGEWFANTWRDDNFGMQFTTSEAGQFLNRSAAGEELVSRTAEASLVISQKTKDFISGGGMLEGISDAVRKGQEGWESLNNGVNEVYKSAKGEDQDIAKRLVADLVNMQLMAMRKDSRYLGQMGAVHARLAKVKTSLAANKVDMGGIAYDFDDYDMSQYVELYTAKNIIPGHTKPTLEQFVEVPPNLLEKVIARVTGREAQGKLIRDYTKEGSGEAILRLHKAARVELIKKNMVPVMGLFALAIIYIYVKKALEEAEGK